MPFASSAPVVFSIIELIRPSKSPHLITSLIGVLAIVFLGSEYSTTSFISSKEFWFISVPVYITMVIIVLFSFRDYPDENDEELEGHFRFARAMGVGTGILGMALAGALLNNDEIPASEGLLVGEGKHGDFIFFTAFFVSLVQMLTFVSYSAIRIFKEERESRLKIFEISFIMFVFLIGFIVSVYEIKLVQDSAVPWRNIVSSVLLFSLWLVYEIFWIRRIFQIVEIRLVDNDQNRKKK